MGIRGFSDSGHRLSEANIAAAEKTLGVHFPPDYRRFLLAHNGGVPEPPYFGKEVVHYFFSIAVRQKISNLVERARIRAPDLPKGVIPIATDPFGNAICLAAGRKNRGKVYFWEHEGGMERIGAEAGAERVSALLRRSEIDAIWKRRRQRSG